MNPNYVHTITIYNCLKAADSPDKKERWYRTVIRPCFYKAQVIRVQGSTADTYLKANQDNSYTVRIPEDIRFKRYREWAQLSEDTRKQHFTVSNGDIVVYGECKEEITGVSGQTAAQLLNRWKPDAFRVTAFSDNTAHLRGRHYRIGG